MEGFKQGVPARAESAERLLEEGKNPGLGIRKLHEQGITGKGVVVGILDQRISPTHSEFKDSIISNKEYYTPQSIDDTEVSMHGPAVVSLLAGKECGVAPDAKVVYANTNASVDGFLGDDRALQDIIGYNKHHDPKIRVVSVSKGYSEFSENVRPGVDEWIKLKQEAANSGITVIDSNYFEEHALTGGGSKSDKDAFDEYNLPLFYTDAHSAPPSVEEVEKLVASWDESRQKRFFERYKTYQGFVDYRADKLANTIIVPSDYRTRAAPESDTAYEYDEDGGFSWAIPYFAGVFALALQVNPDITNDEFLNIVRETAGHNKQGIKVINPRGIIEEVKKMAS